MRTYNNVRAIPVMAACKTYFVHSSAASSTEFAPQPTRDVTIMVSERLQRNPLLERDRE